MRKLLVVLLLILSLSGCGGCSGEETVSVADVPKQAVKAVNVISKDTLVDLIRLTLTRRADPHRAQYLNKLEQQAVITVTNYTENADTITATVSVSAPNMYAPTQY